MQPDAFSLSRAAAAHVAAAALLELFPDVQLLRCGETAKGFFCEFASRLSWDLGMLQVVEERMRAIAKERRPMRCVEMMPSNAASYLSHLEQPLLAQRALAWPRALVPVVQMGRYAFPGALPTASHSGEAGVFKLHTLQNCAGGMRLQGTACAERKQLHHFLKQQSALACCDHLALGQELDLYSVHEERVFWRPRGEALRRVLLDLWRQEQHALGAAFVTLSPPAPWLTAAHVRCHREGGWKGLAEVAVLHREEAAGGLLDPTWGTADLTHLFCSEEQLFSHCISSLQFLTKISKILGFEHRLVLCARAAGGRGAGPLWKRRASLLRDAMGPEGSVDRENGVRGGPRLDLRVRDAFGGEWTLGWLGIDCVQQWDGVAVSLSAYSFLERAVALLLEATQGALPRWLCPEQVRVLAVTAEDEAYARSVVASLQSKGVRAALERCEQKLSARVYEALRLRVPYLCVVGEKERKAGTVAVRPYGQQREEVVHLERVMERIDLEN
jgi:threonyl-tRNA synthetase